LSASFKLFAGVLCLSTDVLRKKTLSASYAGYSGLEQSPEQNSSQQRRWSSGTIGLGRQESSPRAGVASCSLGSHRPLRGFIPAWL